MRLTVLGALGFIGSHLVRRLAQTDWEVWAPHRDEDLAQHHLGHVVYAIGITGDFRGRALETVEADVCRLNALVSATDFASLTYLSSTRIYSYMAGLAREDDPITVRPTDPDDLYNLSKAMAESLLLSSRRRVRILRLSNVYGLERNSPNFLGSLIRTAIDTGEVRLETSATSERDYVSVDDVVDTIVRIVAGAEHAIYNVASGSNVSNGELAAALADLVGGVVHVASDAPTVRQPPISIARLATEFGFQPRHVLDDLPALVAAYRVVGARP